MKILKTIGLALMATLAVATFSACTNDTEETLGQDTEIRLTSEITPASRGTSLTQQSTQIAEGQQVGVTITRARDTHNNIAWTAGASGALTNTGAPVYYDGTETATITAYHPHKSDWTDNTFSVNTDQSTDAGYLGSDLLWATASSSKTANAVALEFKHKLAKINVTLESTDITDLSGATISICGTNIATNFDPSSGSLSTATTNVQEIKAGGTTNEAYTASAIIVPQTVAASTPFIKVVHGGKTFYHKLSAEKTFVSGKSYSYTLTVKEKQVEVDTEGDIKDWENGDEGNTGDANEEDISTYSNGVAYIAEAGELSTVIPSDEKLTITTLKITGELNGTDIKFLREMAGSNTALTATEGKLVNLDLSDAVIVEGGEYYVTEGQWENSSSETYQKYTEDNVLGEFMFYGCKLTELVLPTTVTSVGQYCFANCDALTSITVPEGVQTIGAAAFYNCDKLKDVTLPESLTTMGGTVFAYSVALDNIPEWPANIKTIPSNCFQGCTALTTVTIPDHVTTIGAAAFDACTGLTQITIPSSVNLFEMLAFNGCSSLLKFIYYSTTAPYFLYTNTFSGINSNATLYVPNESLNAYKDINHVWYNIFKNNIKAIESLTN